MQKISFCERYMLTTAVLNRTKELTRRLEKALERAVAEYEKQCGEPFEIITQYWDEKRKKVCCLTKNGIIHIETHYKLNEVVAVAQSYRSIHEEMTNGDYGDSKYDAFRCAMVAGTKGWNNKLFVRPNLMPHQIQIIDINIERLQDISDEDCLKEGVECYLDIISEKGASKYEKHAEEEYWIAGGDGENHYDQSISYCRNCAEKIAKKENKEKGYGEWDNYYHRDGGWGQEHDRSSLSCEECGKPLLFDYIPTFFDDDIEELCLDDISDLYLLNQMLHNCNDEIREKAIQRLVRPAFAVLIDRPGVGNKGLWESNPWVVVYKFKLVK